MQQRAIIIAFFVCLCCINVSPQETTGESGTLVTVIVKKNRSFTFTSIEKVELWGIVVSNNGAHETILYKVIESIKLADSSLVDEIEAHISGIRVTKVDGLYILDFKKADIPILQSRESRIIDFMYVPLSLRLDPVETFEVGLVYSLWPIHLFKHHFSFSTGLPCSKDPSYHVMALNYGIGTAIYSSDHFEFLYRIYFHFKVMERTHGFGSTFKETSTLSIEPQVLFFPAKRAFPSISVRYYFNNFEIEDDKQKLFLIAAFNIAI
jgi:hypothetical protein